jgi:hypothetical protein
MTEHPLTPPPLTPPEIAAVRALNALAPLTAERPARKGYTFTIGESVETVAYGVEGLTLVVAEDVPAGATIEVRADGRVYPASTIPAWLRQVRDLLALDPFVFPERRRAGETVTLVAPRFHALEPLDPAFPDVTLELGEDIPAHTRLEIRDDGRIYAASAVRLDNAEAFADHFGIRPEQMIDHGFAAVREDLTVTREAEIARQVADRIERALVEAAEHQRPAVLDASTLIAARDHLRDVEHLRGVIACPDPSRHTNPAEAALREVAEVADELTVATEDQIRVLGEHLAETFGGPGSPLEDWTDIAREAITWIGGPR